MKLRFRFALIVAVVFAGASVGVPAEAVSSTGLVTGTITDVDTGQPLAGVCVDVVNASSNIDAGQSAATKANGTWQLAGVSPSTSYIAYAHDCRKRDYVGTWYVNTPHQAAATQFRVSAGRTTTGISIALPKGGAVAGKVVDATTKQPVAHVLVVAFRADTFDTASYSACTTADGTYLLRGEPTVGIKVEFLPNGCGTNSPYPTVWYHNATDYDSATAVPITVNTTTTGISQRLSAG